MKRTNEPSVSWFQFAGVATDQPETWCVTQLAGTLSSPGANGPFLAVDWLVVWW